MLHNVMHVNAAITSGVSFYTCGYFHTIRFFKLSYNTVSIEPLVRRRWSDAVDSSPAPEPLVRPDVSRRPQEKEPILPLTSKFATQSFSGLGYHLQFFAQHFRKAYIRVTALVLIRHWLR